MYCALVVRHCDHRVRHQNRRLYIDVLHVGKLNLKPACYLKSNFVLHKMIYIVVGDFLYIH
jgi:hypothetical protein